MVFIAVLYLIGSLVTIFNFISVPLLDLSFPNVVVALVVGSITFTASPLLLIGSLISIFYLKKRSPLFFVVMAVSLVMSLFYIYSFLRPTY